MTNVPTIILDIAVASTHHEGGSTEKLILGTEK